MAFYNKFGGLMRHNLSNVSVGPSSKMHALNAMRCMSSKLFVGGLSWGTDDQMLRDTFSNFGDVTEARVITDRESGRSRGFGFVNYASDESAQQAMSSMDGKELDGRSIRVSLANERQGGGGGGGFRGGYGGGGYSGDQGGY